MKNPSSIKPMCPNQKFSYSSNFLYHYYSINGITITE